MRSKSKTLETRELNNRPRVLLKVKPVISRSFNQKNEQLIKLPVEIKEIPNPNKWNLEFIF
jgi:hypothetical protein